jgi:hypothetical protein
MPETVPIADAAPTLALIAADVAVAVPVPDATPSPDGSTAISIPNARHAEGDAPQVRVVPDSPPIL